MPRPPKYNYSDTDLSSSTSDAKTTPTSSSSNSQQISQNIQQEITYLIEGGIARVCHLQGIFPSTFFQPGSSRREWTTFQNESILLQQQSKCQQHDQSHTSSTNKKKNTKRKASSPAPSPPPSEPSLTQKTEYDVYRGISPLTLTMVLDDDSSHPSEHSPLIKKRRRDKTSETSYSNSKSNSGSPQEPEMSNSTTTTLAHEIQLSIHKPQNHQNNSFKNTTMETTHLVNELQTLRRYLRKGIKHAFQDGILHSILFEIFWNCENRVRSTNKTTTSPQEHRVESYSFDIMNHDFEETTNDPLTRKVYKVTHELFNILKKGSSGAYRTKKKWNTWSDKSFNGWNTPNVCKSNHFGKRSLSIRIGYTPFFAFENSFDISWIKTVLNQNIDSHQDSDADADADADADVEENQIVELTHPSSTQDNISLDQIVPYQNEEESHQSQSETKSEQNQKESIQCGISETDQNFRSNTELKTKPNRLRKVLLPFNAKALAIPYGLSHQDKHYMTYCPCTILDSKSEENESFYKVSFQSKQLVRHGLKKQWVRKGRVMSVQDMLSRIINILNADIHMKQKLIGYLDSSSQNQNPNCDKIIAQIGKDIGVEIQVIQSALKSIYASKSKKASKHHQCLKAYNEINLSPMVNSNVEVQDVESEEVNLKESWEDVLFSEYGPLNELRCSYILEPIFISS